MKTTKEGIIFTIIIVLMNIGAVIWLIIVRKNLSHCESRVSTNCPVFTCDTSKSSSNKCGSMPYRCKNGKNNCYNDPDNMECMTANYSAS